MPRLEFFQNGVLLTGADGFLGSHVADALRRTCSSKAADGDVRDKLEMQELAANWPCDVVMHMASKGTVLTPVERYPEMVDVAVDGLVHLLECFSPKLVIFPSSCAIYGETGLSAVPPTAVPSPLSVYGLTKVICERILCQWAAATGRTAIVLRLGNLIGPGGRGLAAYLVHHAMRYPGGYPPAEMRGGGRLMRDYVPIDYAVRIIQSAVQQTWEPGDTYYFNVGSGKPRTNGQVASCVQRTLSDRGIALDIHYDEQPGLGEARFAVMDTRDTQDRFGLELPTESEIDDSIREAVLFQLDAAQEDRTIPASI